MLTKNLTETTNKIKKAQINFATGVIADDVYKTAITELTSQKLKIEVELEQCNAKLSNSRNRIHAIAQMCCKLGDLWRGGTLNVCQKVQYLAFPNGVEWDKSILNYRTFTVNGMLDVISKLTDNYREKEEDKPTEKSICPLVCGYVRDNRTFLNGTGADNPIFKIERELGLPRNAFRDCLIEFSEFVDWYNFVVCQ